MELLSMVFWRTGVMMIGVFVNVDFLGEKPGS